MAGDTQQCDPRQGEPGSRAATLGLCGSLTALFTTLVLAGQGRPLDDPWLTALAIAAGIGIGAWLLRPGARAGSGSGRSLADVRHHTVGVTPDG